MESRSAASELRWWEHPLIPFVWGAGVAAVYATFPSSDTTAVIAEAIWIIGVIVWMIGASWVSNRFYNGSDKGIAGQSVSQSGNFPEGRE